LEEVPVRLTGQDCQRGTFSHRHAVWVDQEDSHHYAPLANLSPHQGRFEALNTCLSEMAVLGFEYGYSTICKQGLTIWEAQFGDFVNSAQVIIDQYIASGEQKWGQVSGIVLFLPHGFEGQGPEHSSARFERFLTLAGHDNMQIVNPTLPSQLFHLLRRQVKQPHLKPLIVMTPKGLLRHPSCVSRTSDLSTGEFQWILDDPREPVHAEQLLLCSGRIYYDLDRYRQQKNREDVAIIRIEQLYPFMKEKVMDVVNRYHNVKSCVWVQEEPQNMGAWTFISHHLMNAFPPHLSFRYIGREASASPATGFSSKHKQEMDTILQQVFET
jgi:2-oxoglutarate dehydrogenase E1 component